LYDLAFNADANQSSVFRSFAKDLAKRGDVQYPSGDVEIDEELSKMPDCFHAYL